MANNLVSVENLEATLTDILAQVEITDIHSHIYPAIFKELSLWGIDELLNYHYLEAEYFRFSSMDYDEFFALPAPKQAELIWEEVFIKHSPVSEAARGVLTVLSKLGLDVANRDLQAYRQYFASLSHKEYIDKVFELSGVKTVVMTNDPFNPAERQIWESVGNADDRFKTVLRLDPLINEFDQTAAKLIEWGYKVDSNLSSPESVSEVKRFLKDWMTKLDALYMAASLPPDFYYPEDSLRGRVIEKCILPVCKELTVPFALMIGSKPGVNPKIRVAGYGMGRANCTAVENLCKKWPENKFLVTLLSRENQHEICILARKFRNLLPFGCWWFLNNPVIIEDMTRMRLETLGLSFIPQHSDARVIDQLIYKWDHSKLILKKVMVDKYKDLLATGWQLTREEIQRDMDNWFGKVFWDFIAR